MPIEHPKEPGKWTRLDAQSAGSLWRRERADPFPVTQFYLLAPPRQAEIFYDEAAARARFEALALAPSPPAAAGGDRT